MAGTQSEKATAILCGNEGSLKDLVQFPVLEIRAPFFRLLDKHVV